TCSPWRHPIRQRSHKITNAKQGAYVTPLLHRSWDITRRGDLPLHRHVARGLLNYPNISSVSIARWTSIKHFVASGNAPAG
ncbi:hypothetical protein, partial [Mycobacterium kiyosense]|uniref:hypothetical protein n=1 Tax=Mycobacterium kiyosense TaxID=2871094 RepID=UPI0022301EE7